MKLIGPITKPDWVTMQEILASINWMRQHNTTGKYSELIKMEKELYATYMDKIMIKGIEYCA